MGQCNTKPYDVTSTGWQTNQPQQRLLGDPIHKGSILGINFYAPVSVDSLNSKPTVITCSDDKNIATLPEDYFTLGPSIDRRKTLLEGHSKAVNRVSVRENWLYSASRDLSLRQWNLLNNSPGITIPSAHELNLSAVVAEPFNTVVYTGSRDYHAKGWNTETAQKIVDFSVPRNIITCMAIDPSGQLLFQGSEDLCVRVWDVRSNSKAPAMHLTSYVYFPLSLSLSGDGNLMATGCKGFDGVGCEVKLWDIRRPSKPIQEMHGHRHDVTSCVFSSVQPHRVVSASKDGSICAWDCSAVVSAASSTTTESCDAPQGYQITTGKYYTCITSGSYSNSSESYYVGSFDGCVSRVEVPVNNNATKIQICIESVTTPYFSEEGAPHEE